MSHVCSRHVHPPCRPPCPQRKIAARDEASLAHEKAAVAAAQELEARVASFDTKEKATLRVSAARVLSPFRCTHVLRLILLCTASQLRCTPPPLSKQELAERETALAGKESKLAAQHAELAERGAGGRWCSLCLLPGQLC